MTFKWKKYWIVAFSVLFSPVQKIPPIKKVFVGTLRPLIGHTGDNLTLGPPPWPMGPGAPFQLSPGPSVPP